MKNRDSLGGDSVERKRVDLFRVLKAVVGGLLLVGVIGWYGDGRYWNQEKNRSPGFSSLSEERGGQRSSGGRRGFGPSELKIRQRFDVDSNGWLDSAERARARLFVRQVRVARGVGDSGNSPNILNSDQGVAVSVAEVEHYPESDLYDLDVLRTLFLEFEDDDWLNQLNEFLRTDVEIVANLSVDGEIYNKVGVRVRGNTSSLTVPEDRKRSLNITLDPADVEQRLYGYKTLNLLNAHTDPTFLRELLFNLVARNYIPAAKANYVRLVINGRSWGIYINSQQFNKDFLDEWFGRRGGVRWKVQANPRQHFGLMYLGDDPADYERYYELRDSEDEAKAWVDLIHLCQVLNSTPQENLIAALEPIFDIDGALWFAALDNVFIDNDGYWIRASDYSMYQDSDGRFHLIPHDNNETFQLPGGPGYSGDRGTGVNLDPLFGSDDDTKAVIHRLLAVPKLKARYLAHVRTIAEEWLSWDRLEPLVEKLQSMIDEDVQGDVRKLYSYDQFVEGVTQDVEVMGGRGSKLTISLQRFVEERREALLKHPSIALPGVAIESVNHRPLGEIDRLEIRPGDSIEFISAITDSQQVAEASVYFSNVKGGVFNRLPMSDRGLGYFSATLPAQPPGQRLRYYVEVASKSGAYSYYPKNTEHGALKFRVTPVDADQTDIVINEVVADNVTTVKGPHGEFVDWIELRNLSDQAMDLSGLYLSDSIKSPLKWQFPEGASIRASGYLVIWVDGTAPGSSGADRVGELHASFKLSKGGEIIVLVSRDDQGNQILDRLSFPQLGPDQAYGLTGKEGGATDYLSPSPGMANGGN